jgi:hypothetical protein
MASWALIMEAVNTSEILVTIYQTSWCNIAEDSHHICCHEDQKYHALKMFQYLLNSLIKCL